jgi:hypothetical protein
MLILLIGVVVAIRVHVYRKRDEPDWLCHAYDRVVGAFRKRRGRR